MEQTHYKCLKDTKFDKIFNRLENLEATANNTKVLTESQEQRIRSNREHIVEVKQLTESIHKLATSVALLSSQMEDSRIATEATRQDIKEVKQEVADIKNQPARDYQQIKMVIVTAAIGIILGAIATTLI